MTRNKNLSHHAWRAICLPTFSLALVLAACDNHVNFSPTQPAFPNITPLGERSLQITGTLVAEDGSIAAATILYDGLELPGAHTRCSSDNGCSELELAATTRTAVGVHTISFQTLEQSAELVAYRAQGNVLVNREGALFGGVNLVLGPKQATLRAGELVVFEIEFRDDW